MTGKEETNNTEEGAVKKGTCQRGKGFVSVLNITEDFKAIMARPHWILLDLDYNSIETVGREVKQKN